MNSFFFTTLTILVITIGMQILMIRNFCAYQFVKKIQKKVYRAAKYDITHGKAWEWRYEEMAKIPYSHIVLQFWKPLESFYDPALWRYGNYSEKHS